MILEAVIDEQGKPSIRIPFVFYSDPPAPEHPPDYPTSDRSDTRRSGIDHELSRARKV